LKLGRDLGSRLPCEGANVRGVVVSTLADLTVLSLRSLLDFIVDALDKPSTISNWKFVVVPPVHPEVISEKEEGFQHYQGFILRS
jgi:hypothetical protein